MKNNSLILESKYHNNIAEHYFKDRKNDFLWEIPEEIFIFKKQYFFMKNVIEMGCGPAYMIAQNDRYVKVNRYLGIDISKKMIKIAEDIYPKGKYKSIDISSIKIKKTVFDTVLALGSLHHTEDKIKTLENWIRLLKRKGYLILREPTYEALKRGSGASPTEEGIKVTEIISFLQKNHFKDISILFFSSQFFHFLNRLLIKMMKQFWLNNKILWYPIIILDIFVSNTLGKYIKQLRGEACIIIARKS
jgi:SAM-dependent methyltransferase